jgi:uncharacterized repeat protein (TIGR03803 family)
MKKQLFIYLIGLSSGLSAWGQTSFYGMIRNGGTHDSGIIFKTDLNGNNRQVLAEFGAATPTNEASEPWSSLMQASNGKLYGTTYFGGTTDQGAIFEFNQIDNTVSTIHSFNGVDGNGPSGTLLQASNGKIYGTTVGGGTFSSGTLFEFDLATGTFTKKVDFETAVSGSTPACGLVELDNGKLFGTANNGGANGDGVLFEYDIVSETYTIRHNFDYPTTGQGAQGTLCKASNGKLYGTSISGGASMTGVLFEFDPITYVAVGKHHFDAAPDGGNPYASVIQASNGKLYGTAQAAGVNGQGTLFEFDLTNDLFSVKYAFNNDSIGSSSLCPLMEYNGKLYGLANFNYTTLFEYDIDQDSISQKSYFEDVLAYGAILGGLIVAVDNPTAQLNEVGNNLSMQVYPNPFSDQTTLKLSSPLSSSRLVMRNQLGQIVREMDNINGTLISIERKSLPNGIYFIALYDNGQVVLNHKVIITE